MYFNTRALYKNAQYDNTFNLPSSAYLSTFDQNDQPDPLSRHKSEQPPHSELREWMKYNY